MVVALFLVNGFSPQNEIIQITPIIANMSFTTGRQIIGKREINRPFSEIFLIVTERFYTQKKIIGILPEG